MKRAFHWILACAVLVAAASGARAQDAKDAKDAPPADTKALDAVVYSTLRTVINRGADLYNAGDASGCYRLFEGSLTTIKPFLDHRPELQKAITTEIAAAEKDPVVWRRSFALRKVLDRIRSEVNPKKAEDKEKVPLPKPGPIEKKKKDDDKDKKDDDKDKPEDKKKDEKKKKDDDKDKPEDKKKEDDKKKDDKKKDDDKATADTLPKPRAEGGNKDT
jgi:hypothetical protein